ncbi:hypothetical protein MMC30_009140 [Trapelia coarctata]|nr:hypothetical protein [Trapelia coarctata]
MSLFAPSKDTLESLRDKVIVLTGGANGIGASTVNLLHNAGACVVFGDTDTCNAEKLISELRSPPNITFIEMDVNFYTDNLEIFKTALSRYSHIDYAISIAGVTESGSWFSPSLIRNDIEATPSCRTLNVNLLGPAYFTRVISVYLAENRPGGPVGSITLLSSIAGLENAPYIPIYGTSKHGIIGLMRSLRSHFPDTHGLRVNAICPYITDTALTANLKARWLEEKLPWNEAVDVATVILNVLRQYGMNGKALYIAGGKVWEV